MLPGSSPSHENLAAELLPIEYRLLTLFLICSSLAVCVNTDFYLWDCSEKSSSGSSTRTRC